MGKPKKQHSFYIVGYDLAINGIDAYNFGYSYDALENIEAHTVNGSTITYVYDELNRLTRENNPILNKTFVYTYDFGGNITSKKTYSYTTGALGTPEKTDSYTYGNSAWKDQLTAYNGVVFSYDASGNPLNYYNGDVYHFTWEQGRRLATATKGANTLSFTYNSDGIRTSKTVNGITHNYVLNGTSVYSDTWVENNIQHIVVYIYDDTGSPIGMAYRNSTMADQAYEYYFFANNAQGDIVAIYNPAGAKLIEYKYDAWGNTTIAYHNGGASTSARYNSLTYRGYFYDSETGLYYLNSRYYDPAIGRFINPDNYINANGDITGFNMYAYCGNNPVNRIDPTGEFWFTTAVLVGVVAGMVINFVSAVATEAAEAALEVEGKEDFDWGDVLISTGIGGLEGGLSVLFPGASIAISATGNALDTMIDGIRDGDDIGYIATNTLLSAGFGAVLGSEGSGFSKQSKLINDAGSYIVDTLTSKTIHPVIKQIGQKTVRKAGKYVGKEMFYGFVENIRYGGIYEYASKCSTSFLDRVCK